MRKLMLPGSLLMLLAVGTLVGCSSEPAKSPDVADSIRKSLDQSGLKAVRVSQDRTKGVVTLDGQVPSAMDKSQAETIKFSGWRASGGGSNHRRPSLCGKRCQGRKFRFG